ncbi:hypothetical protein BLNAU_18426 [Blattamonas nauphoetae]|uniref:Uncharacterized protein n=1 Tax=Blattamonas nauphoetae TaxID=2049346 RepID=A0ABQ9X5S0_9EUKA|nr:hypothetical protein BLNAU_18426 [Blattamonas nauphoetae]
MSKCVASECDECVLVAEIIHQAAVKKFPTSSEMWMTCSFCTLSITSSELKLGDHLRTTLQHLLFRVTRLPLPAALSPTERAEQDSAIRIASDAHDTLRFGEHPHVTHKDHPSAGTAPLDPIDAVASLSPSITRTSLFPAHSISQMSASLPSCRTRSRRFRPRSSPSSQTTRHSTIQLQNEALLRSLIYQPKHAQSHSDAILIARHKCDPAVRHSTLTNPHNSLRGSLGGAPLPVAPHKPSAPTPLRYSP